MNTRTQHIPFTQYLRPDGRPVPVLAKAEPLLAAKARRVIGEGFAFECEVLMDGAVSLTVVDPTGDDGGPVDILCELAPNGPAVTQALARLVNAAHDRIDRWDAHKWPQGLHDKPRPLPCLRCGVMSDDPEAGVTGCAAQSTEPAP